MNKNLRKLSIIIAMQYLMLVFIASGLSDQNTGNIVSSDETGKIFKEPEPSFRIAAPFSRHEDRYQKLYAALKKGGIRSERIAEIFSSKRAKQYDEIPVKLMSEKVISPASIKSKDQIDQIVQKIKVHLENHKAYYDKLENLYGVNREIAASIFFKETYLGEFKNWKHESFTVLNSIVSFMDIPADADDRKKIRIDRIVSTALESLKGLLLYCDKYGIDILSRSFPSSFAGAIGIPQFMPMYMEYVISDSQAVPDLSQMPDAILSVGNLLKNRFNWKAPIDFSILESIDSIVNAYVEYDKQKGVSFCMSKDLDGYPLRRFIDDFREIPYIDAIAEYAAILMDYNYSSRYVLDVLQLAFHTHKSNSVSIKDKK